MTSPLVEIYRIKINEVPAYVNLNRNKVNALIHLEHTSSAEILLALNSNTGGCDAARIAAEFLFQKVVTCVK
jgi:hypothetical protein